ncbi:MAG: TonB-dependent receptor [Tannerellaceae bacterium]|nr:TonB-dependent receptor [Tannerellaceae bacterium]
MSTLKHIIISVITMMTWINVTFVRASINSPETQQVNQEQKNISGVITDINGEVIAGANIRVKGTMIGTSTDADGRFVLTTPREGILEISYVGYVTQEVNLAGKSIFNIRLIEDSQQLNEVVVIGYGTQKKVNLTGAVTSVNMDEVVGNRPIVSVASALLGNTPGVTISGFTGEPGSGYNINVRGVSSINGGSPLILVDNVAMSISDINPEDIESISVLKDASAAAVYGARAAFGVILVTTKKAEKEQRNKFNYSAKLSLSNPQSLGKRATPFQTVTGFKDAGYTSTWTGQNIATWFEQLALYEENPSLFPEGWAIVDGVYYSLRESDPSRDLLDDFGTLQIHDFSVSGGSSKSAYRISLGYLDEDGIVATDKDRYRRYNLSSFFSVDVTSWMTTQLSLLYSNGKKTNPSSASFARDIWTQSIYTPSYYPTGGMEVDGEYHPFATPRNILDFTIPNELNTNRINMMGRILVKPFKDLTVTGEYSKNHIYEWTPNYRKPVTTLIDGMTYGKLTSNITESTYRQTKRQTDYQAFNLFATYNQRIKEHEFTLTAGINTEYSYYEDLWAQRLGMINEELPSIGQGIGLITAGDDFSEYSIVGTFYRLNYAFKDRYLFETSGRYDGSSKFPKDNRFGFFPSFSMGWRISEEVFMENIKSVISNLKLRGSWGSIGNQNIDPYSYNPGMEAYLGNWLVNGQKPTSLRPPALVRSNFTWEEVRTVNGGIDIGLFNNRFNGTFDIFRRQTLDMLGPGADYPAVIGASAPLQNAADMETKGWELQLSLQDKIANVFYSIGFNISDNVSKITKFNNESKILTDHYVGKTMGEIWGYEFDRFYTADDFVEGTLKTTAAGELTGGTLKDGIPKIRGSSPNPGDVLFKHPDENGDIWASSNTLDDPGSKRIIGNNSYRYMYGITANVSWKGFDLSVLLQGTGKRQVWQKNSSIIPYTSNYFVSLFDYQLDYWTPDHTGAFYPRIYQSAGYNTGNNTSASDRYLLDASYLDIKSVVFSYNLPKMFISRLGLEKLTIFINGENLWSFNHYPDGIHPDNANKGEGATYPIMRKFTGGLNVTF